MFCAKTTSPISAALLFSGDARNLTAAPAFVPLGTYDEISGQISPKIGLQAARAGRFALLQAAGDFLREALTPTAEPKPFRVLRCLKNVVPGSGCVAVLAHNETGSARYSQLRRCGSVWTCPMCSAQVSEVRTAEIAAAMTVHTAAGGVALMLTLTHSHRRTDDLKALINGERQALKSMTAHRDFKQIMDELGLIGTIRAREVTYGQANGWHPHTHEVMLIRAVPDALQIRKFESRIFTLWQRACQRAGLPAPSRTHGAHLERAFSPAEYLAKFGHDTKWGSARELTKAHSKRGGQDRYTPFDLLRGILPESQARSLFVGYAKAFYGARQITWSRGLKKRMALSEVSDSEIVEGGDEAHRLVTLIGVDEWRAVVKAKARAKLLDAAETGGAPAVQALLAALPAVPHLPWRGSSPDASEALPGPSPDPSQPPAGPPEDPYFAQQSIRGTLSAKVLGAESSEQGDHHEIFNGRGKKECSQSGSGFWAQRAPPRDRQPTAEGGLVYSSGSPYRRPVSVGSAEKG